MTGRTAWKFFGKSAIAVKLVIIGIKPYAFEPFLEIQDIICDLIQRRSLHLNILGFKRRSHDIVNRLGMKQKTAFCAKLREWFEIFEVRFVNGGVDLDQIVFEFVFRNVIKRGKDSRQSVDTATLVARSTLNTAPA